MTSAKRQVFVHGGPGYPTMWYSRGLDGEFIKQFVVVHWDQRGAGKSQSPNLATESITLNQIVDDGLELTRHLKQKFDTERIILVGHSWGTMVAANMVHKSPEDFLAFVSVGTCAAWQRGEQLRYRELQRIARERQDDEAIRQLQALGPPPYRNAEKVQRFGMLVHSLQGYSGTSRKLSEQQLAEALGSNLISAWGWKSIRRGSGRMRDDTSGMNLAVNRLDIWSASTRRLHRLHSVSGGPGSHRRCRAKDTDAPNRDRFVIGVVRVQSRRLETHLLTT